MQSYSEDLAPTLPNDQSRRAFFRQSGGLLGTAIAAPLLGPVRHLAESGPPGPTAPRPGEPWVLAPPFHVQTTAKQLKNGYPYFSFHDSISALWQQKWRPACAQGKYPFGDGQVEDFDPIFAQLIARSGDRTEFLYQPDQYAKPFFPVAEKLEQAAHAAQPTDPARARALYLRAAAVYRMARVPINRPGLGQQAWQRGKAAYERGGQLLPAPIQPVQLPFTGMNVAAGDENKPIGAYLRLPLGQAPPAGWPVLLFICGLDAYRTDETERTQKHVDAGFATLIFEIPGTGDCPAAPNDPSSPDRLLDSVLHWVEANAATYQFDAQRICVRGVSTGGFYAIRAAHTHAGRLYAVVAQGGSCHYVFHPEWIGAQNQMAYPFALADGLAYKFGYRSANAVATYQREAGKFSLLTTGVLAQPTCRLLLIDGMEDSVFPIEDTLLVALQNEKKDLIVRSNCGHMGDATAEAMVYAWLQQILKDSDGQP